MGQRAQQQQQQHGPFIDSHAPSPCLLWCAGRWTVDSRPAPQRPRRSSRLAEAALARLALAAAASAHAVAASFNSHAAPLSRRQSLLAPSVERAERQALVTALVSHVVVELGSALQARTGRDRFACWSNSALLNCIYLFSLGVDTPTVFHLSSAARDMLVSLRSLARSRLQKAFDARWVAAVDRCERVLSPLQKFQFAKTFGCERPSVKQQLQGAAAKYVATVHRRDETAELQELAGFIIEVRAITQQDDFTTWTPAYVRSWTGALHAWTATVSFISIQADSGTTDLLPHFLPLWKALLARDVLRRWCALGSVSAPSMWTALVCAVLYLASHTIFAQTLYHTQALDKDIIGLEEVASLFRSVLPSLQLWNHVELVTEGIAVRCACKQTETARVRRQLCACSL
jgi:hypothetical protein